MAADLFETYAVTIVATMVLASIFFPGDMSMMIYPLTIGGACILTSIIGTFFVKLGKSKNVMGALYKGFIVSRSEEHTSELQSQPDSACRLLFEKKKKKNSIKHHRASAFYQ